MKKSWPILALALVLVALVGASCHLNSGNQDRQADSASCSAAWGNTTSGAVENGRPLKALPYWRKLLAWPNGVETLGILLTLIFIAWQALLTRQAIISAEASSKAELRAYVGVTIGDGMWQEREKGYRFGALPILTNSGQTPAHKVRLVVKAGILPVPLPPNQKLSEIGESEGETTVGINQPMILHARVDDFCRDEDVEGLKAGDGDRCLYAWGIIRYCDVFGDEHYTRFCHRMKWLTEGKVYGYYEPNRNDAN